MTFNILKSFNNHSLKKIKISIFTLQILLNNNNFFFNLSLNNFLCKSLSTNKSPYPFELIFSYFTYLFSKFNYVNTHNLKDEVSFSFIFEIIGSSRKYRFYLKNLIISFLKTVSFKKGRFVLLEKTFTSFNGSTLTTKKRKKKRKKKRFSKRS